jgi:hypothetical protein
MDSYYAMNKIHATHFWMSILTTLDVHASHFGCFYRLWSMSNFQMGASTLVC